MRRVPCHQVGVLESSPLTASIWFSENGHNVASKVRDYNEANDKRRTFASQCGCYHIHGGTKVSTPCLPREKYRSIRWTGSTQLCIRLRLSLVEVLKYNECMVHAALPYTWHKTCW